MKRQVIGMLFIAVLMAACSGPAIAPVEEVAEPAVGGEAAVEPDSDTQSAAEVPTENFAGCVENYAEGVDYFPEKAGITDAEGFEIEYFDNYKVMTILSPWPGAESTSTVVMVQCGTPAPAGFDDATMLEVPIETIVPMSTTFVSQMESLGVLDSVVGLDSFAYVNNLAIRERIDAGELTEIGAGAAVNIETTLDLEPDVIMTHSFGPSEFDNYSVLREADLPVILNSSWVEATPLGRTEWIKYIAALYNREAEGEAVFNEVATEYEEASALALAAEDKPTVFVNDPFEGVWYQPTGTGFQAQLLKDAGADYLWADSQNDGSLELDIEAVFDVAQDADFWVNTDYASLTDMEAADPRFTEFEAYQNGDVYANIKRQTEYGNEYWEWGVANPHLILKDLIKIFHPELMEDHEFVYYIQLQ